MTNEELIRCCEKLRACESSLDWLRTQPADQPAVETLAACDQPDWLLWLAHHSSAPIEPKMYVRVAVESARLVLDLAPAGEKRPAAAVALVDRWLAGEAVSVEDLWAAARASRAAWATWAARTTRAEASRAAWAAAAAAEAEAGDKRAGLAAAAAAAAAARAAPERRARLLSIVRERVEWSLIEAALEKA